MSSSTGRVQAQAFGAVKLEMFMPVVFDGFSNAELQLSGFRNQHSLIDCRTDTI